MRLRRYAFVPHAEVELANFETWRCGNATEVVTVAFKKGDRLLHLLRESVSVCVPDLHDESSR
jgi:hypothetical protein